jgi:hypothetical protein
MNTKTLLACTAVVIAFALIVAPLAVSDSAFAKKSKQGIFQESKNYQKSTTVGKNNILSGNNVNFQGNFNSGSNVAISD